MSGQVVPTGSVRVIHVCGHKNVWLMTSADRMSPEDYIKIKSAELCPTCKSVKEQPSPKIIYLAVDRHPCGNHTLKYRFSQTQMPVDFKGDMLCNEEKGVFYRAVAREIAALSQEGFQVFYEDVSD